RRRAGALRDRARRGGAAGARRDREVAPEPGDPRAGRAGAGSVTIVYQNANTPMAISATTPFLSLKYMPPYGDPTRNASGQPWSMEPALYLASTGWGEPPIRRPALVASLLGAETVMSRARHGPVGLSATMPAATPRHDHEL